MQIEFQRRVQLIAPELMANEKLDSDTIFAFLNAYQKRYAITNYVQLDQTQTDTRVQKKVSDAIKGLIVTQEIDKYKTQDIYSDSFLLPSDFLLYIRSQADINALLTNNEQQRVPTVQIKEEEVNIVKPSTAYNSTAIIRTPYIVINAGNSTDNKLILEVIHDMFTQVNKVWLTYCREPKQFNVLHVDNISVFDYCEMPENVHMELVEGAVEMFITEAKFRLQRKEPSK